MTLVRRFPARIVKQEHATDVVCPMHDALSAAQRANLLLENPLSYLNVTRSALDMPGASYEEIGAANAAGLERLLRSDSYGALGAPAIYVYRIDRERRRAHRGRRRPRRQRLRRWTRAGPRGRQAGEGRGALQTLRGRPDSL